MSSESSSGGRRSSRGRTPTSSSSAALQATVSSTHSQVKSRSRSPRRGSSGDSVPPSGPSHSGTSNADGAPSSGTPGRQRNVKISHILIKHKGSRRPIDTNDKPVTRTKNQAMRMVIDIHEKICGDLITFADAAVSYSECTSARRQGDIQKQFQVGRVQKTFEDAAFALGPGEVSDVIESKSGYHILQRRE